MALILLRHTRTAAPAGTCYGWQDVPLCEPHQPDFAQIGQALQVLLDRLGAPGAPLRVRTICSSPLQRAARLAAYLADQLKQPLALDARWRELHFGEWEGRRWPFIPRHQSDPWADDPLRLAPPGGETLAAMAARVRQARDAWCEAARAPGEAVLVVGHAGPMRVLLSDALGQPLHPPVDRAIDFGSLLAFRPGAAGWVLAEAERLEA